MIFQVFASIILCSVVIYAYSQARMSPNIAFAVIVLAIAGEYLVLVPSHATSIAGVFGIGRGADLIFYLWILLSLVVALNLHLKLRTSSERLVRLVRALALRDAEAQILNPDPAPGAERNS